MSYLKKTQLVDTTCYMCGSVYETYQSIETGDVSEIFCSSDCIQKYYSKEEVRERKINLILKD
jgi:hypothetical protein